MPTPKAGTVTNDIATAVREIKAGRIEFKNDKHGVVSNAVGKLSFSKDKLIENIRTFVAAVSKAKPAGTKGHYMVSLALSSTMGPGLKVDMSGMTVEA
jgi:large subunit ribosomal protein L1